jgi:hypothetical protein
MCQTYPRFIAKPPQVQKRLTAQCGALRLVIVTHLPLTQSSHSLGSMNPAQMYCRGCKNNFSFTGYSLHVAKTRRAKCRAVHALESSPFRNGSAAASESLVDSRSSLNPFFDAARRHGSPADHPTPVIGHEADPDPDISVPNDQTNGDVGEVFFDFVIIVTANLGLCFRL